VSEAALAGKTRSVTLVSIAELLAMSLWFSASAVVPQLETEWALSGAQQSWLTMSVQLGFVAGALAIASWGLADRVSTVRLFAWSAVAGAVFNALIPAFDTGISVALVLRFLTGVALAGVYPPGMRLMATWTRADRGLGIGLLVGALTLGSALPHLLNAVPIFGEGGLPPWSAVLWTSSALALAAAFIVRMRTSATSATCGNSTRSGRGYRSSSSPATRPQDGASVRRAWRGLRQSASAPSAASGAAGWRIGWGGPP
jgi:MFS family permease